jgi:protein PhnA
VSKLLYKYFLIDCLHLYKDQEWANDIINSVELSDSVIDDAIRMFEIKEVHKDCNGIVLENGDNVVLTQVLNVKGANFMAPKGNYSQEN